MAKNAVIGALRVNLGLDSAKFETGLQKSGQSLGRFGAKANKEAKGITSAFGGMGAAVSKTFVSGIAVAATAALAPILSVAAALGTAKSAMREFSQTGDVAQRLGVDVERLQELRFAAEQGGMAVDNFDVAFRRFIRRSSEAAQGTGAAKDAFKELNVQLHDGEGRLKESDKLLGEVADALQKVQNPADKLRLAFKLFDTDGAAMVNVLARGSAGLEEFSRKARELGIVVDRHLIERSQELSTEFETATQILDLQFKQALVNLAPIMVGVAERAARLAGDIRSVIDSMRDLENQGSQSLDGRMRSLGAERLDIENRILAIKQEQRELTENARDLGFGGDSATVRKEISDLENRLAAIADEEARILKILDDRKPAITPLPTTPPPPGGDGSGGRNRAAEAALREAEAVKALIADLQFEREQIGLTDLQKRTNETLRRAGAAATAEEREQIIALVAEIERETEALKINEEAQKARTQAIESLFQMGEDALLSMIDNSLSAEEALKRLVTQLAKAALQAALLGSGPLGGLFGGGIFKFAEGGSVNMATGGRVSGPGTGTSDSIPAMLSDGEFVVNARSAQKFGPLLEAINSGAIAGFKHGGFVNPIGEAGPEGIIGRAA